jgi:uncharacterized protein (TIGR02217 family)
MAGVATFPVLPGQGVVVHKKPRWNTTIALHANGRESRMRRYQWPLFDFELTFDGLDAGGGRWGNLGAFSFQTLAGFFDQMSGPWQTFLYVDPTDWHVFGQALGVGDGLTRSYTFVRPIGPWVGPVDAVTRVLNVYLNGVPFGTWGMGDAKTIVFAAPPPNGAVITADFQYAYAVRFSDEVLDFEEFMGLLMTCKTVKLQGVRAQLPALTRRAVVIFLTNTAPGLCWVVPNDWNNSNNLIEYYGAGAGGSPGSAGGAGGYAWEANVQLTPGQCCPYQIGIPGLGVGGGGFYGNTATTSQFQYPNGSVVGYGGGAGYLWFNFPGGGSFSTGLPRGGYTGGSGAYTYAVTFYGLYWGSGGGSTGGPNGAGMNGSTFLSPPGPLSSLPFGVVDDGPGGNADAATILGGLGRRTLAEATPPNGAERTATAGGTGGAGAGGASDGDGIGGKGGDWGGGGGSGTTNTTPPPPLGQPGGDGGRGAIVISYTTN